MVAPKLPILTIDELKAAPSPLRRLRRPDFLLQRGPFRNRPDILSLEPARGFNSEAVICPTQAQQGQMAEHPLSLVEGASDWLGAELSARSSKPRIVMIGQTVDPFQPVDELQREVGKTVDILAYHGVSSWLSTRGMIQSDVLDILEQHRDRVRVTVSITTLDGDLLRALEPQSASANNRLKLIETLKERRIPAEVALDPLIAGLTDSPNRLGALLSRLSELRVERIIAAYLILRPGVKERLAEALEPAGLAELILDAYSDGPMLREGQQLSQFLHKSKRQRGYALLMSLAAGMGMTVRLGELGNPDFQGPARIDSAHHMRSLQQSFRESEQSVKSSERAGA
jgi:DNA repair photolyase